MPRAWSIEELRRFEEIREGLNAPKERQAPARQRPAAAARARRASGRRPGDPRAPRQQE